MNVFAKLLHFGWTWYQAIKFFWSFHHLQSLHLTNIKVLLTRSNVSIFQSQIFIEDCTAKKIKSIFLLWIYEYKDILKKRKLKEIEGKQKEGKKLCEILWEKYYVFIDECACMRHCFGCTHTWLHACDNAFAAHSHDYMHAPLHVAPSHAWHNTCVNDLSASFWLNNRCVSSSGT